MMAKAAAKKNEILSKKRRKGRPPLPDPTRFRRPNPNPNPSPCPSEPPRRPRTRRRRPLDDYLSTSSSDDEQQQEPRGRRKLKLVLKLPHFPAPGRSASPPASARRRNPADSARRPSPSASSDAATSSSVYSEDEEREEFDEEEIVKPPKKRRIERCDGAVDSDGSGRREERKRNVVRSSIRSFSGTPLPARVTLEPILDKLQKKDTYRVFAQPVDLEELPDYHDVIEHPMDFGTVRRKLASGAYRSFEQFEDDVFLICSNAMQYNAPDTVYFRQARAIQDMARKKFQEIRADGVYTGAERKSEEKIRFVSLEKKLKKPQARPAPEPPGSDISSGATLTSAADTCNGFSAKQASGPAPVAETCAGLSTVQANGIVPAAEACTGLSTVQDNGVEKSITMNGSVDGNSSLNESKSEKADEVPAKCSPSKVGPKPFHVDENRRVTYNNTLDQQLNDEPDSVFDVFECEKRELVTVGLDAEYSYARSLAHFAASLGPVAWEIASKRIEQALPPGVKFGPGWVGEYEPLPTPVLSLENRTQQKPIPRKDNGNGIKAAVTQNGHRKDMPFGLKSQTTTGVPSNKTSKTMKEGSVCGRAQVQKQGLFGVNLEAQARSPNTASHQQNQAVIDFTKAYPKEKPACRPEYHPEAINCKFPTIMSRDRNFVQPETQRKQEATILRKSDALGVNVSGLSNGRISDSGNQNISFGIIPNYQAGVQYWLARGGQEQATGDPLRWINTSGNISNQPNISSGGTDSIQRSMPTILPSRRENSSVAAARAWMSIGASGEWKSVDGGSHSNKQAGSASFVNSAWKTPTPTLPSGSRFNEDSKMRPEPIQGVSEASQVQTRGLNIFPQLATADLSRLRSPWQGQVQHNKQRDMLPPDLNISFQPPGSPVLPSSGIFVDSQQPDLALQL